MNEPSPGSWQVRRQDDHGNVYVVEYFGSQGEAEEMKGRFEEKAHKQMYWVERIDRGQ